MPRSARPHLASVGSRLYAAALFLYPPGFRREFSSEMARDFTEATEDTRRAGRQSDLLALWARVGADLATTIVVQWIRTGLPILAACSIAGAVVAASVAANVLPRAPVTVPAATADRDLMTLILLTGVVLVVIVATILFTFWFSRPLLRRNRRSSVRESDVVHAFPPSLRYGEARCSAEREGVRPASKAR
ncbi:MAG TPA: hypothetical protein VFI56_05980 [Vicinamibacterales bacterium]|jgi:hypothetical protein|nr:hypothetical protein [Vicinamibacterales bacterium]